MKVDYDKNLWIDYGAGEGGTLIDLVMRMEWCDAGTVMRLLEQQIGGATTFSFQEDCPALPERTPSIIVEDVLPLEIPALLFYLMERGIDLDTARAHCSEVHYRVADKPYFAVGFRNDTGGWELRNRYFKGCTSKAPSTRNGGYPTMPRLRGVYRLLVVPDAQTRPESFAQYYRAEFRDEPLESRAVHRLARAGLCLPRQRRCWA